MDTQKNPVEKKETQRNGSNQENQRKVQEAHENQETPVKVEDKE